MKKERLLKDLNLDETRIAVQGYSPVSYFEKGIAEMGSPEFAVTHDGTTYYLTSAEQAEKLFRAGVPVEEARERYAIPERFSRLGMFSWNFTIGAAVASFYRSFSR